MQTVPERTHSITPITYVSANPPAFLIQHGTADCNVPPQQSQLLYNALKPAVGADTVPLNFIDGASHGGAQFWTDSNLRVVMDFLAKYLK